MKVEPRRLEIACPKCGASDGKNLWRGPAFHRAKGGHAEYLTFRCEGCGYAHRVPIVVADTIGVR